MQSENQTSIENLEIISAMINKAKNQYSENGHLYLVWGWTVLFCSFAHFILLHIYQFEKHYLVWMLCWLVLIYQFVYIYRREKRRKVRTYTDDIVRFVWIVFVGLIFLFNYLYIRLLDNDSSKILSAGFLALYGMPTILSGVILKFRALVVGGICCWLLCLVSPFITYDYHLLLLGLAVLVAWIIPGYLLRKKFLKQNG